jgi:hypothetical protein
MKKNGSIIISFVLLFAFNVNAQQTNMNFFESNGVINTSDELTSDLGYTLTHLDNLADDVVWAQVVYSIIDMRDNRNSQLAFPADQDANYKNMFRLLADAVVGSTPVYYPNESGITPNFDPSNVVASKKLSDVFFIETNVAGAQYIDPLFDYDSIANTLSVSNRIYDRFSKSIHRFLVQKVYYFDKHLSQLSSKIIGIAPLMTADTGMSMFPSDNFMEEEEGSTADNTQTLKATLKESILCWLLYDDLKSHFSTQPVYQESNAAQRVSYHEYFSKKMFADYLIGDNNLMKRLYSNTETFTSEKLSREIKNIEDKLIAIESGLY